jgi:hypothetical protein
MHEWKWTILIDPHRCLGTPILSWPPPSPPSARRSRQALTCAAAIGKCAGFMTSVVEVAA